MFKKTIITILFVALGITETNAEPSKSVKWLMNEPASLFDIGMMRMRLENANRWTPELIEKIKGEPLKMSRIGNGSVVYDWKENTITVGASFKGDPEEKTCSSILRKYKEIIFPSILVKNPNYTMMDVYFSHINHSSGSRPKKLNKELDKMIVLTIGIEKDTKGRHKSIFCSTTVDTNTPTFQRYDYSINY